MSKEILNVEEAVRDRYSAASNVREAALCCPVNYNKKYLEIIPEEVIARDYGCGDPSQYVKEGETVLDLGSGGGKICFIASQIVGEKGKVIGVDVNDEMLDLAHNANKIISKKLGYENVRFYKGEIQDLKLNRDHLGNWLAENPVSNETGLKKMEDFATNLRKESPMIPDNSIDVVVSNCVLNLVDTDKKIQMFNELFRVLKPGGRAVISDIISDEEVPVSLRNDPELWSGCISGAYEELAFMEAFEEAGFQGIELDKRDEKPWQTVEGIEFRSVTVVAWKPKEGRCWEHNDALVYKGPFKAVQDDDGHMFLRGERVAVCRKTAEIFSKEPYASHFYPIKPLNEISVDDAKLFVCEDGETKLRTTKETKGEGYKATETSCGDSGCC